MKSTGMVRRIDELGRVVIPKEIRKTLRIKSGDPMEICTERDELIFKKYSPVAALEGIGEAVCKSVNESTGKTVLLCDMDSVMVAVGGCKNLVGKTLSGEIDKLVRERRIFIADSKDGGKIYEIVRGEPLEYRYQAFIPIVENSGDIIGVMILLGNDGEPRDSTELKLAKMGADIIARQFE